MFHLRRSALAPAEAADWAEHRHEGVGSPASDQQHPAPARVRLVSCRVALAAGCSVGSGSTAGDIGGEVAAPPGYSSRSLRFSKARSITANFPSVIPRFLCTWRGDPCVSARCVLVLEDVRSGIIRG